MVLYVSWIIDRKRRDSRVREGEDLEQPRVKHGSVEEKRNGKERKRKKEKKK